MNLREGNTSQSQRFSTHSFTHKRFPSNAISLSHFIMNLREGNTSQSQRFSTHSFTHKRFSLNAISLSHFIMNLREGNTSQSQRFSTHSFTHKRFSLNAISLSHFILNLTLRTVKENGTNIVLLYAVFTTLSSRSRPLKVVENGRWHVVLTALLKSF